MILVVDLPPLYPSHLWEPEGSPLRILLGLRGLYAKWTNDPYFVTPHAELPPWFRLFTLIEGGFQLPMALWMFRVFKDGRRGTTPRFELACLVFAVEVALTSLVCVWDVAYWDPSVYSVRDKNVFVFAIYGPWVVIRTFLPSPPRSVPLIMIRIDGLMAMWQRLSWPWTWVSVCLIGSRRARNAGLHWRRRNRSSESSLVVVYVYIESGGHPQVLYCFSLGPVEGMHMVS